VSKLETYFVLLEIGQAHALKTRKQRDEKQNKANQRIASRKKSKPMNKQMIFINILFLSSFCQI